MMSCARGRIRNDSGKIIERDGLLSKRHLDQQTSKFRSKDHQGLAPVLRNSEPRCLFLTFVTLELDAWRFLAPFSLLMQGSEPRVKEGDLESSPPLFIFFQADLQTGERTNLSECPGYATSCSSSGENMLGQVLNRKERTKPLKNSPSTSLPDAPVVISDVHADKVPEVYKPVKSARRKSKKKKRKQSKKCRREKASPTPEIPCEETTSDTSVSGVSIGSDKTNRSENLTSSSLSVHDITVEQHESNMSHNEHSNFSAPFICTSYGSEIHQPTTCFSERSASEEVIYNQFDMGGDSDPKMTQSTSDGSLINAHRLENGIHCDKSGSILLDKENVLIKDSCPDNWRKDDDTSFCSITEDSCEKGSEICTTGCSSSLTWLNNATDTDYSTEKAECSSQASSSDDFQPVINRKRSRLSKKASQTLPGIHRFGADVLHNRGEVTNPSIWQAVQKDNAEYICTRKKANLISTYVESSSQNSIGEEKYDTPVTPNQNASSFDDCGRSEILTKSICLSYNVPDNFETTLSSASKQGNHHPMMAAQADDTNVDRPYEICVQPKVSELSPQLIHQQCISCGFNFPCSCDSQKIMAKPTEDLDFCQFGSHHKRQINTVSSENPIRLSLLTDQTDVTVYCERSKVMHEDIHLTDTEGHKCLKAECVSSLADNSKLKNTCSPMLRKSVSAERKVHPSLGLSIYLPHAYGEYGGIHDLSDRNFSRLKTDLDRIVQAVHDSCKLQTELEGAHLVAGSRVAGFENFLHSASPLLDQICCRTCFPAQLIGNPSCIHQIPNIPLEYLWQWYEKPGSYGIEVKVEDYYSLKGSHNGVFGCRAYFVPYISAIQLFSWSRSSKHDINFNISQVSRKDPSGKTVKSSSYSFAKSFSSGEEDICDHPVRSTHLDEGELLFEYFESDLPQQRKPLFEKIKELVRGGTSSDRRKVYGDPSKLDCFNLIDLHPASWYSVAWYPIYRIPEGKFRAAFLTYHSLGHFPRTTSKRPGGLAHIVSPVVGLQSYNAKGECWFQPSIRTIKMAQTEEALSPDPSEIVKDRLRMLEQTASAMARASVCKNDRSSVNRQPDYEFFMSRR